MQRATGAIRSIAVALADPILLPQQLFQAIVGELRDVFDAGFAAVLLREGRRGAFTTAASSADPLVDAAAAARLAESLLTQDSGEGLGSSPALIQVPPRAGSKSANGLPSAAAVGGPAMLVPFGDDGLLVIAAARNGKFTEKTLGLAEAFVPLAEAARAHLGDGPASGGRVPPPSWPSGDSLAGRRIASLEVAGLVGAIRDIGERIAAPEPGTEPALQIVAEKAAELFEATLSAILVPESSSSPAGSGFMTVVALAGQLHVAPGKLRVPIAGSLIGDVYRERKARVMREGDAATGMPAMIAQFFGVRSAMALPFGNSGVMAVASRDPSAYDAHDLTMLSWFSELASIALMTAEAAHHLEQERLGDELHGGAIQVLYAAYLLLDVARTAEDQEQVALIDNALEQIGRCLADLKIRSLQAAMAKLSLGDRLMKMRGHFGGLDVELAGGDLPPAHPWTPELTRIALEAVSNAFQHAVSRTIVARFAFFDGRAELSIEDHGHGFDVETASRKGLGIAAMRTAAEKLGASLSIDSSPGEGSLVRVLVEEA